MLLPIVRRISPGSASWEKPRSAKSPIPTTRTVVRSRGCPSRVKTSASASMNRCGTAWPAPEPATITVAPSGTSRTAASASTTFMA